MKISDFVEKRRFKRLGLSLPMKVTRISEQGKESPVDAVTVNVSYNGVYVVDLNLENIKSGDSLHISLSVPREDSRDFPFSRITGKARVVRLEKDGNAGLEFEEDISGSLLRIDLIFRLGKRRRDEES